MRDDHSDPGEKVRALHFGDLTKEQNALSTGRTIAPLKSVSVNSRTAVSLRRRRLLLLVGFQVST